MIKFKQHILSHTQDFWWIYECKQYSEFKKLSPVFGQQVVLLVEINVNQEIWSHMYDRPSLVLENKKLRGLNE